MVNKGFATKLILPPPYHFGYVTKDIERSIKNFSQYFGLANILNKTPNFFNKTYYDKPEQFEVKMAYCRIDNCLYEFIQTIKGPTVYDDFLKEHGEGIHHLGYEIDNLADWISEYAKLGIITIMSAERIGARWAYFNTPEIIIELVEISENARIL